MISPLDFPVTCFTRTRAQRNRYDPPPFLLKCSTLVLSCAVPICALRIPRIQPFFGSRNGQRLMDCLQDRAWQQALDTLCSMVSLALRSNLITCSASVGISGGLATCKEFTSGVAMHAFVELLMFFVFLFHQA